MAIIATAEDAINTGDQFVRKYYPYLRPVSAKKEAEAWHVVFNVSIFFQQQVEVRIDSETGSIIEFNDLAKT